MVLKCCVPRCRGNYDAENKAHVFRFPKDGEMKKKWIRAIPRENFSPSKYSVVCHRHFVESDILWETAAMDENSGKMVVAKLLKPQIHKSAVPSVFLGCPSYLSKTSVPRREEPDRKRARKEAAALESSLEESIRSKKEYEEKFCFKSFTELKGKIFLIKCSEMWNIVERETMFIFFHLNTHKSPHDILYFILDKDLIINVFVKGVEIKYKNIPRPNELNDVHQIENFMNDVYSVINNVNSRSDNTEIVLDLIEKLPCEDERQSSFEFIKSQLNLCMLPRERYRYSSHVMIFATLLYFISSHAYKFLRSSGNIILPHPNTVKNLCSNLDVSSKSTNFLNYIKEKVKELEPHKCFVTLMIDEIHVKPYMDFKGGNIVGMAHDNVATASTAHVFMINSILSNFKDVVHIVPVNKMTADVLNLIIHKVVLGLEKIGLKVVCVITDNNSINRKAVSLFSTPGKISIVYPHPADKKRPLFYLIDSVHIFKNIRNNWLNQKNEFLDFVYPDFENKNIVHKASFSTLRQLFNIESDKLVKFGYGLSVKALWPTTFERQNVKLVMQVFNDFIIHSLLELGTSHNLYEYEGTANFIKIIVNWWNVLNVKSPTTGLRLNDSLRKPLTNDLEDETNIYLNKFLKWLDHWEGMTLTSGKLTKETHTALKLTTYSILEVVEYCTSELGMSYILPGKFQTDVLEARFGQYRQLAGSQYHISMRQLLESEKKLRLASLLELNLQDSKKITVLEFESEELKEKNVEDFEWNDFFDISVEESDFVEIQADIPVLTYIAGYCCYSILKKIKCDECKDSLVLDKEMTCGVENNLIRKIDRGGLLYPAEQAILIVMYCYIVTKKILNGSNEKHFLESLNQRQTLVGLIKKNVYNSEKVDIENAHCDKHLPKELVDKIIWISSNILLNNYCKMKNNQCEPKKASKRKVLIVSKQ